VEVNSSATALVDLIFQHRVTLIDLDQAHAERDSYRLLAEQALHRLAEQQIELDRLRDHHHRLVLEYRAFRAATIREERRPAA
jgi:hypothetical protein